MEVKINGLSPELISHPSDTVFELMISNNFTPLMLANELKIDYLEFEEFIKEPGLQCEIRDMPKRVWDVDSIDLAKQIECTLF